MQLNFTRYKEAVEELMQEWENRESRSHTKYGISEHYQGRYAALMMVEEMQGVDAKRVQRAIDYIEGFLEILKMEERGEFRHERSY